MLCKVMDGLITVHDVYILNIFFVFRSVKPGKFPNETIPTNLFQNVNAVRPSNLL